MKTIVDGLILMGMNHPKAIDCDGCGKTHPVRDRMDYRELLQIIASDGWIITGEDFRQGTMQKHFCPDCNKKPALGGQE